MSSNEKAEAILLVIKKLFKWAALLVVGLIAIIFTLIGLSAANDWYSKGRHKNKVIVSAVFNAEKCGKEFPVYVGVFNNSSKIITNLYIDLKVTKDGYSSAINKTSDSIRSDFIIKPDTRYQSCWAVYSNDRPNPKLLDGVGMHVEVDYFSVTFKD
jgi:hypothetical protein